MKKTEYVYTDDDSGLAAWMTNFTSRQGDGGGDPEEAYLQILDIVAECKKDANWLEIGAGFGRTAEILLNRVRTLTAIEPDAGRFQGCVSRFANSGKNITILNLTSSEYRAQHPERRHDAILLSMVLQHVPTPVCDAILRDVKGLLDDDGLAIISTTQSPVELFTFQRKDGPVSEQVYNEYAASPSLDSFGLPVRRLSKARFLKHLHDAGLEVVAWNQFCYIRPEKTRWIAQQYGLEPDDVADVADSQYAIVKRAGLAA